MDKIIFIFLLLFIIFLVGIAIANNHSLERPLDQYIKPITDLFTTPVRDENDINFSQFDNNQP